MKTKKSDGSRNKGPAAAFLHTPLVEQPIAEGAAQGTFLCLSVHPHHQEIQFQVSWELICSAISLSGPYADDCIWERSYMPHNDGKQTQLHTQ